MAIANVADLITTGVAKNSGISMNSQDGAAIFNQINKAAVGSAQSTITDTADLIEKQKQALQSKQAMDAISVQTNQMLGRKLADEQAAIAVRSAGAMETKQVLQGQRDKKLQELGNLTIQDQNSSFWSNPLNFIKTKMDLAGTQEDVQQLSDGIVLAGNSIDDEYKTGHQNYLNFQNSAAMLAQQKAETDARVGAETAALDVQITAERRTANVQAMTQIANDLKVDPVAQQMRMDEYTRKQKLGPNIPAVMSYMASHGLDVSNPTTYQESAANFSLLAPAEQAKWADIGIETESIGKGYSPYTVLQSAVKRDDAATAMKIISNTAPEVSVRMLKAVENSAVTEDKLKLKVTELEERNKGATGKNKLSPGQLEMAAKQELIGAEYSKGIKNIFTLGTAGTENGLGEIAKTIPQEMLDGKSLGEWAGRDTSLDTHAVAAMQSPNVQDAYNKGHYEAGVGGLADVLDHNASRMLAGVDAMVKMGIKEDVAIATMTKTMGRAMTGILRTTKGQTSQFDEFSKIGITLQPKYAVKSIKVNNGFFSSSEPVQTVDILNPVELSNLLSRMRVNKRVSDNTQAGIDKLMYGLGKTAYTLSGGIPTVETPPTPKSK